MPLVKKAQALPALESTLAATQPEDVWSWTSYSHLSCVRPRPDGVWVALCRRTQQVVSWFAGNRLASQLFPLLILFRSALLLRTHCSCKIRHLKILQFKLIRFLGILGFDLAYAGEGF